MRSSLSASRSLRQSPSQILQERSLDPQAPSHLLIRPWKRESSKFAVAEPGFNADASWTTLQVVLASERGLSYFGDSGKQ